MFARAGAHVTLCDKKLLSDFGAYGDELMHLGVRLSLGDSYLDGLVGQDMVLRTPGFGFYTPELQKASQAGAVLTSEMELFFEHCPCRKVGITGSDGKTTTTSLIAAMYKAAGRTVHLGGNIGRALLPIVDEIAPEDVAVVELSSFQLISMRTSPNIALVLNITPNHLDQHAHMQEYIDAKRNILLWQNTSGLAVLGFENEIARSLQKDVRGECRFFSRIREVREGAWMDENGMLTLAHGGVATPVLHRDELKLRGVHNIENMLAAFAALRDEVPLSALEETARSFAGVEHRIELVRTLQGVQWYNDSIASSPTRVIAGLRAFDKKLVVIAGGYDKNIPYEPMVQDVLQRVKLLILMGATGPKIEKAVRSHPDFAQSGLEIQHAQDMAEAVQIAYKNTGEGDIVTLSPASASFDAYANFEERGRHYKQLVNAL